MEVCTCILVFFQKLLSELSHLHWTRNENHESGRRPYSYVFKSPRICLSITDWVIYNIARGNWNDSVLPVCIGSFFIWYQTHAIEDGRTLCCNVQLFGRNSRTIREIYCLHFRRYRKITKFNYELRHFCLFDRPSVRITVCLFIYLSAWNNSDFHEICSLNIFRKQIEKSQISLKSNKNNRYFIWIFMYIYGISLNSF